MSEQPVNNKIDGLQSFYFHRLEIRLQALSDTFFSAWVGAYIRANLEAAAQQIPTDENKTLLEIIVQGNTTRGFSLSLPGMNRPQTTIAQGDSLTFDLFLTGKTATCFRQFIEALHVMSRKGMGHPQRPFQLLEVNEISFSGEKRLLFSDEKFCSETLSFPIKFVDFQGKYSFETECKSITVRYDLPMQPLFKVEYKKDPAISYQDKLNGIPNLYSLVKKSFNRLNELNLLYCEGTSVPADFLTCTVAFALEECELKMCREYRDTPGKPQDIAGKNYRKNPEGDILSGFVGKQVYIRKLTPSTPAFVSLIPALKIMEILGVNNRAIYGLDRFVLDIKY
jgi:hypothetical protein